MPAPPPAHHATPAAAEQDALPCAGCGYDLRAQPREGICPECATPVEKAIELAAIPVRPAWRDSDPRWRRRMIAGAWVLVMVPLVEILQRTGLASRVRVGFFDFQGYSVGTLEYSFVTMVYTELVFCIGVVLFFAKESGRRRHWSDRTKRWGVFVSYLVLLLTFANLALIVSLVTTGIAAVFMSLPIENQPAITPLMRIIGYGLAHYGPHDSEESHLALSALSAAAVLLACVPVYQALRCSGARMLAWILVVPLAATALVLLAHLALWFLEFPPVRESEPPSAFFLQPGYLLSGFSELSAGVNGRYQLLLNVVQESLKWLSFLGIALWLSLAQVRAWRKPPPRQPAAA